MKNKIILITLMLVSLCVVASAQNAKSVLEATMKNIGEVKSIQYSGSGAQFTLGQSVSPDAPWPRVEIKSFTRTVDYEKSASRQEGVGAQAPMATQFYAGAKAWGQAGANVTPAAAAVAAERQLQIWLTPHGFLKGALAHNATAKRSGTMTLITFTAPSKHRIVGTISVGNLVEKVETWLDNPVLGDMHVETTYSSYHDFGAFKFPAKIVQKQGGHPILDVTIADAKANVALDLTVPDAVLKAVPPPVQVTTEKLADGVWYLAGGTHYSVLVEFYNHVVVIEAPQNEDRSLAVIAEVKKLVPTKPLRYLINTHHHFDHSGGLRTFVAEGATIITHQTNKAFYETNAKAPHTLNPDRQASAKKKAKVLAIGTKHVLSDATRSLELHHIQGSPHNTGILMAWLPKEKVLIEVDVYNPLALNAPPPSVPNPGMVNLYENIQRLNLDVDRIAALHGRMVTLADLKKTIGK